MTSPLTRRWVWIVLGCCAAWILIVRLHTATEPIERDIAIYSLVAEGMRSGRAIYRDTWEMKPPVFMCLMVPMQALAGSGASAILLVNLLLNLAALWAMFAAGRRLGGSQLWGCWAAILWALLCGDILLQGNQPNTEVAMNLLLIATLAWALNTEGRFTSAALAGGAIGVAMLTKTVALFPGLAMLLACGVNRRWRWGGIALTFSGLVLLCTSAGFWAAGLFSELWDVMVGYSLHYRAAASASGSVSPWRSMVATLFIFLTSKETARWAWVLIALIVGGFWRSRPAIREAGQPLREERGGRRDVSASPRGAGWLLAAYAIGSWVAIAAPGYHFAHYFQLALPPMILGAVFAMARAEASHRRAVHAAAALSAGWFLWCQLPVLGWSTEKISEMKYGDRFVEARRTAQELNALLRPEESFYNWGVDANLYVEAGRRPPTGLFLNTPLLGGPLVEHQLQHVLRDLEKARPEAVVVSKYEMVSGSPQPRMEKWIRENYCRLPDGGDRPNFLLLMRRGGALERRLIPQR